MRSPGTRRAVLLTGAATAAVLAVAGCSAGQVAETALLQTAIPGVDIQSSDGSVVIRNLQVVYNGVKGYPAGGSAPLEFSLFNRTTKPVTVLISSRPATNLAQVVSAKQVGLVGGAPATPSGAAPEPSGSRPAASPISTASEQVEQPSTAPSLAPAPSAQASAPAAAPAAQPARITLAPLGSASFLPGDKSTVQVIGLTDKLLPGTSVNLVFEFSNGAQPLEVPAPVGVPLSPASRAPGIPPNENLGHGE